MNWLDPHAQRVGNGDDDGVEGAIEHYRSHGYARLGKILSDQGLETLRARAEALMLGKLVHQGMFFQLDASTGRYEDAPLGLGWQGPSLAYRKLEKLEKDEAFRAWLTHPFFERVVKAQIRGGVNLYRAILFNKSAEQGGSDIPWHQDGGKLWGLTQNPELQIWTALDDADEETGCLQVVPSSHREGLVTPLGGVIPQDRVMAERAEEKAVALPTRAGEVLLIHNMIWHRSGRGRPGTRRMAFSACYLSEEIRCTRARKSPREFFKVFS